MVRRGANPAFAIVQRVDLSGERGWLLPASKAGGAATIVIGIFGHEWRNGYARSLELPFHDAVISANEESHVAAFASPHEAIPLRQVNEASITGIDPTELIRLSHRRNDSPQLPAPVCFD